MEAPDIDNNPEKSAIAAAVDKQHSQCDSRATEQGGDRSPNLEACDESAAPILPTHALTQTTDSAGPLSHLRAEGAQSPGEHMIRRSDIVDDDIHIRQDERRDMARRSQAMEGGVYKNGVNIADDPTAAAADDAVCESDLVEHVGGEEAQANVSFHAQALAASGDDGAGKELEQTFRGTDRNCDTSNSDGSCADPDCQFIESDSIARADILRQYTDTALSTAWALFRAARRIPDFSSSILAHRVVRSAYLASYKVEGVMAARPSEYRSENKDRTKQDEHEVDQGALIQYYLHAMKEQGLVDSISKVSDTEAGMVSHERMRDALCMASAAKNSTAFLSDAIQDLRLTLRQKVHEYQLSRTLRRCGNVLADYITTCRTPSFEGGTRPIDDPKSLECFNALWWTLEMASLHVLWEQRQSHAACPASGNPPSHDSPVEGSWRATKLPHQHGTWPSSLIIDAASQDPKTLSMLRRISGKLSEVYDQPGAANKGVAATTALTLGNSMARTLSLLDPAIGAERNDFSYLEDRGIAPAYIENIDADHTDVHALRRAMPLITDLHRQVSSYQDNFAGKDDVVKGEGAIRAEDLSHVSTEGRG